MSSSVRRSIPVLFACSLSLAACGDPPRLLEAEVTAPEGGSVQGSGGLPEGHPPLQGAVPAPAGLSPEESVFGGRLLLVGDLADSSEGAVFVSIMPRGQTTPVLTKRILLAGASDLIRSGGELVIPFRLDESDNMVGMPVPPEVDLKASYKPGGFVESPDAAGGRWPVRPGDLGLEFVLEPAPQDTPEAGG